MFPIEFSRLKLVQICFPFFVLSTVLRLILVLAIGLMFDNNDQTLSYHLRNLVYAVASSRV